jgi:hypothetical protein
MSTTLEWQEYSHGRQRTIWSSNIRYCVTRYRGAFNTYQIGCCHPLKQRLIGRYLTLDLAKAAAQRASDEEPPAERYTISPAGVR